MTIIPRGMWIDDVDPWTEDETNDLRWSYGKGGGGKSTTTVAESKIPEWMSEAGRQNFASAVDISQRPYAAYNGQRVAGLSPDQAAAQAAVRNMQGQGQAQVGMASNIAAGIGGYQPQQIATGYRPQTVEAGSFLSGDIGAYMSPYTSQVIDSSLAVLDQGRRQALNQTAAQATAANAFGGSRHGIQEGVVNSQAALQGAQLAAQLRQAGYDQAASQMTTDQNRALTAAQANQAAGLNAYGQYVSAAGANQQAGLAAAQQRLAAANSLGNLANVGSTITGREIGMLDTIGAQNQALSQAQLDQSYNDWLAGRNYPIEQLNTRLAALGATPYSTSQTQTSQLPQGDRTAQTLGTIGSLASIGMTLFSDRRSKTDIERLGRDPESGEMMYAYRYKSDPKSYPKVVGIMADDVEDVAPQRVRKIGGKQVVDVAARGTR